MRERTNATGNNFGALRLFFASLVIVSHSPELIDGNRSREILTRLFGTLSFGEVGVDGFFLISGYLITKSFAENPDWGAYLTKRIYRIYPGYLVAFWVCVFLVSPFAGLVQISPRLIAHQFLANVFLLPPDIDGVFAGMPYRALNGAMWTIAYEFRCYLAVLVFGLLAIRLGRARWLRWALGALVIVGLAFNGVGPEKYVSATWSPPLGTTPDEIRLLSVFGAGALFYLFRGDFAYSNRVAALSLALLVVAMQYKLSAEFGYALFGGYVIFWIAFKCRPVENFLVSAETDISYGIYLYAWPIASLIIWNHRNIDPWALCAFTLLASAVAGYASWTLVEKRANAFARNSLRSARLPLLSHPSS